MGYRNGGGAQEQRGEPHHRLRAEEAADVAGRECVQRLGRIVAPPVGTVWIPVVTRLVAG
jgi:hypothetical protein